MAALAVSGATSWGLTLAWLLQRNAHDVTVVVRRDDEAATVSAARGIARLSGLVLPPEVSVVPAPPDPAAFDGLVLAVPVPSFAATAERFAAWHAVPVLSASKGIELRTRRRPSELLVAAGWPPDLVTVLSGPNLAREIAAGLPAAAVTASAALERAEWWQRALSGPTFRVYTSTDVIGVEVAGAAKNVIAIAAGVAAGCGFGANAIAALVTRGLAEITRLGVAMGAQTATFLGLAGVGDLAVTCFSPLSRNHRLGELLATGMSAPAALAEIGEAVEGAATAPVLVDLAHSLGVDVPLSEQVAALLAGRASVAGAIAGLLGRDLTTEAGAAPAG